MTSATPSITLKWKDSIIDPAWLKANGVRPNGTIPEEKGAHWTDQIHKELEIGLNKALDPEMFEKTYKPRDRPEGLEAFDTFLDAVAQVIQDLFAKRAKLPNAKAPLDVAQEGMDSDDLQELLREDLGRLLRGIIHAALLDPMPEMEERQIIRCVWENDIKENSTYCDITTEEIAGFALDTISDDELMAEARRRGLLARLPSSAQAGTMTP
jgi:hypothetical protein